MLQDSRFYLGTMIGSLDWIVQSNYRNVKYYNLAHAHTCTHTHTYIIYHIYYLSIYTIIINISKYS